MNTPNNTTIEHRDRALDRGLRQTSTGSCPRRLVSRAHLEEKCWCCSRLNDHGRRYRATRDDRPVVLWEPYNAYGEELAAVLAAAAADGLRVSLTGASPWNPGSTFAIAFTAEATL